MNRRRNALGRVAAALAIAGGIGFAAASFQPAEAAGITATLDQGTLTVSGTGASDIIIIHIAPNDPAVLHVDAGGDGQADFAFDLAAVQAIAVQAKGGNDVVGFNQTYGPITVPADVDGGAGDDDLSGGSRNDTIDAGAGNDTANGGSGDDLLHGKAGADRLFGGAGGDTLAGGTGDDELDGEAGDDRLTWSNGDETDRIEGGPDTDTVEVTGALVMESFTVTANGTRVRFDRLEPEPFALDIGTSEHLVVLAGGGDDSFGAVGNLAALIAITVDGGSGNDTILGSNGVDILAGGSGNDFLDGQQGNDALSGGTGNDTFQWDPGDGSDTLDGQGGNDRMLFNGSNIGELFEASENAGHVRFTRNIANIVMDLVAVEAIELNVFGGPDVVTVHPVAAAGLTSFKVNAAGFGGAGDAQTDTVVVVGTSGDDTFRATRTADSAAPVMSGLGTAVTLVGAEPAFDSLEASGLGGADRLIVNDNAGFEVPVGLDGGADIDTVQVNGGNVGESFTATANGTRARFDRLSPAPYAINVSAEHLVVKANGGEDSFSAVGNLAALVAITVEGGDGNDTILGSNGIDVLIGGAGDDFIDGQQGNDTLSGGADNDTFQWDPGDGSDALNGQGGNDRLAFNGSNIGELFEVSADAGQVRLSRNIANIIISMDNIERLDLNTFGGADVVTIHNLAGTDMDEVSVNLAALGGAGDTEADSVIVNGTTAKNVLTVTGDGGAAAVSGLRAAVNIAGAEPTNDRLTINALAGNDVVSASGLTATAIQFTADGGEGNDSLTGGAGDDTLFGGEGNDTLTGGPGLDILDGGPGANTVSQD